jgi:hypothetical protein
MCIKEEKYQCKNLRSGGLFSGEYMYSGAKAIP